MQFNLVLIYLFCLEENISALGFSGLFLAVEMLFCFLFFSGPLWVVVRHFVLFLTSVQQ